MCDIGLLAAVQCPYALAIDESNEKTSAVQWNQLGFSQSEQTAAAWNAGASIIIV